MSIKPTLALIANDMRLHWRGVVSTQAGMLAFMALVFWANRAKPTSTLPVAVSFISNVNFFMALLWGEWLVSREKTKGTFAWLRTLPISDKEIVTAKMLTCSLWCLSLWVSSSLLFVRAYFFPNRWSTWLIYQLALLAFAIFSLAGRWRFRQKLGMILPMLAVLVPVLAMLLLDQAGVPVLRHLTAFYSDPRGKVLLVAGLAVFCAGVWWATVRWVSQSDTYELLE